MIRIQVTSDMIECVRTFKKDRPSIIFLKRIKRLHQYAAEQKAGPKPPSYARNAVKYWRSRVERNRVSVKIEITHVN